MYVFEKYVSHVRQTTAAVIPEGKNRTGTEKCNKERIKLNLKHREEGRTGVRKSRKNLW